jgi:hypothetical protein
VQPAVVWCYGCRTDRDGADRARMQLRERASGGASSNAIKDPGSGNNERKRDQGKREPEHPIHGESRLPRRLGRNLLGNERRTHSNTVIGWPNRERRGPNARRHWPLLITVDVEGPRSVNSKQRARDRAAFI